MRAWALAGLLVACGAPAPRPPCAELDGAACLAWGGPGLDAEDDAARREAHRRVGDACERLNHPPACAAWGHALLERGDPNVPQDAATGKASAYGRAVALLAGACEAGEGAACWTVGGQHSRGRGVPRSEVEARRWFAKACAAGHQDGCVDEGVLAELGRGGPPDAALARARYEAACAAGLPRGCTKLGLSQRAGLGGPADGPAGVATLERACGLGDLAGCGLAALAWEEGDGVPVDPTRRVAWLEAGVRLQDPTAARLLDGLVSSGALDAGAQAALAARLAPACDARVASACLVVGRIGLREGWAPARVAAAWRVACMGSAPSACGHLAALAEAHGLPDVAAPGDALLLHERACVDGLPASCLWLGRAYEAGAQGVDHDQALEVYTVACQAGLQEACDGARRVAASPPRPRP